VLLASLATAAASGAREAHAARVMLRAQASLLFGCAANHAVLEQRCGLLAIATLARAAGVELDTRLARLLLELCVVRRLPPPVAADVDVDGDAERVFERIDDDVSLRGVLRLPLVRARLPSTATGGAGGVSASSSTTTTPRPRRRPSRGGAANVSAAAGASTGSWRAQASASTASSTRSPPLSPSRHVSAGGGSAAGLTAAVDVEHDAELDAEQWSAQTVSLVSCARDL
jgi:hypothetical protein